ncbi:PepSY domain-containing protein [Pseudoxanthomonas japonensis]|uniref:Peptidase M4 n=1 Tax=Pseudoxanthomonas japonensis TaxID=69284 RepID=A0ABQ6ZFH2_9GAMM|nr:PepSY domain-containing protein [Pseudoxanthomonas japonensis]KAF1724235.1 peptidase M4 [Pseudoxanthomonas japonensis]
MQTIRLRHRLLTLATLAALSGAAFAQAPAPTVGKDAMKEPQVRALLAEKGYTNIDDLDFEDGMWETDATSANGDRVDVRINPATGAVMAEKLVSNLSENDVKAKLAAAGYSKIHDVDFDDGVWKAEAERADGNDVEIHLAANTGEIIHVEND